MPLYIEEEAFENSTFILEVSFFDESEESVMPKSVVWSLTDIPGNLINNRDEVIETPSTTIYITLSGDDLAIEDDSDVVRVITIKAIYDSDIGTDLPLIEDYRFKINNVRAI